MLQRLRCLQRTQTLKFAPFYRHYCISDHSKHSHSEIITWDEAEEREQMKLRAEELENKKRKKTFREQLTLFKEKYNNGHTYFFLGLLALLLFDIFRPRSKKTVEVSPYDPDLYYVKTNDGNICRYYIKKDPNMNYVTKIELDEKLAMNGKGETKYRDGTYQNYFVVNGFRQGKEEKIFPPGNTLEKAEWENVDDHQVGYKYLHYNTENIKSPLSTACEVFEAKSHKPLTGGYFAQLLANGDQVEARIGFLGLAHGPARLTTTSGDIITDGFEFTHGKLSVPDYYLEKNGININAFDNFNFGTTSSTSESVKINNSEDISNFKPVETRSLSRKQVIDEYLERQKQKEELVQRYSLVYIPTTLPK